MPERPLVSWVRNALISCGAFLLSLWMAPLLGWSLPRIFNTLTLNDQTLFTAIVMGAFDSKEWIVAGVIAVVLVTLAIPGRNSHWWGLLVAALYLIDFRVHATWAAAPTTWDRTELRVERFSPAAACIVAAFVTAYVRRNEESETTVECHRKACHDVQLNG